MEGVGGNGASAASTANQSVHNAWRLYQHSLDKATPHTNYRWIGTFVIVAIYCLRLYYIEGFFYLVSYGLGIYLLNLLIYICAPVVDPETANSDGPMLPIKGSDEFKPFIRLLPEFKFWYAMTKAFCIAFVMTFFSLFDVPAWGPFLLFSWILMFVYTMWHLIAYMIKYKYIPFSIGKQKYEQVAVAHVGTEAQ